MKTIFSKGKSFFDYTSVLNQYFKEINAYPLLTKADEDKAALSPNKENLLVKANLRYAVRLAHSMDFLGDIYDLIQCANIGLVKAAKLYNPQLMNAGGRFINFARNYMLGEIYQFSRKYSSAYSREDYYASIHIGEIREKYFVKYGEYPSVEIIAREMRLSADKVQQIMDGSCSFESMDRTLDEETTTAVSDTLSGDMDADRQLTVDDNEQSMIDELRRSLNKNEFYVVRASFGIGMPVKSIDDIAAYLHLTNQRCNQIKKAAIEKLKTNEILREML